MKLENEVPLYSSKITITYIEYLTLHYADVDIDAVLKYAGMTRYEVEDSGHWFTQSQVDRFHEKIVAETGNENIAREAGRYTASSERIGPIKQYSLGLMSISTVYLMIGKLYSIMSRGADASATSTGSTKVELVVTPRADVKEKPYQCQNRIGTFESLAKLFVADFSKIEESVCIHKGGDCCHYHISWNEPPTKIHKKLRNYLTFFSFFSSIILFFILPVVPWMIYLFSCISVCSLLSYRTEYFEKMELSNT
ncbi:MAG: phosphohydrolase, partial [Deltaproteobacteria bacterium]|nr:phosphohydrolase [Deltaproteobacteria bacterium]